MSSSSSVSSSLLDSTASSILGASAWNRRKANRPVQGRPTFGFGNTLNTNNNEDYDNALESRQFSNSNLAKNNSKLNINNNNNNNNHEHQHLLTKRRYPIDVVVKPNNDKTDDDTIDKQDETTIEKKSELEIAVLLDCLHHNFLFAHLSDGELQSLLESFEKANVRKNEIIIRQGEPALYFYMLYSGDVVYVGSSNNNNKQNEKDGPNSSTTVVQDEKYTVLGELALLTSSPYDTTIKATSPTCTLFRLSRTHLQRALQPDILHPHHYHHDGDHATSLKERMQTLKTSIPSELVEYFKHDETALKKLAYGMSTHFFQKGDVLYQKKKTKQQRSNRVNKNNRAFVIVIKGLVVATELSLGGRTYEDMLIGPGESQTSFGWHTIVATSDEPTQAGTIVAKTDGIALVITKEAFANALGHHPGNTITLEELAAKRLARIQLQQITVFRDSALDDTQINGLLDLMHHLEYSQKEDEIIFKAGEKVEAAMYIVRKGCVTLEMDRGRTTQRIERGGYFGEKNMLLDQNKDGHKHFEIRSPFAAIAHANSAIDVLYLEECRKVVNTTLLGLGKPATISAIDESITLSDLDRHALLGTGTFGQVWLATTASTGEHQQDGDGDDDNSCGHVSDDAQKTKNTKSRKHIVALKVQAKYQVLNAEQAERVVTERNVLASLHSPFIIRLYNAFQDESRLYMITSLLQGGELESLIPEDGLSESAAKFYAAGILEGLTYMHRRHIIHRDVKPENVLINDKGYPVLIDFGFAKYVPDKTYTFCGSPMFTAPEIIRYKGHDKACDHWSWAVVVYRMVTGKYPFYEKGMDELTLYKRICKGSFELDGTMSMEFRMLMVSILYPDPTKRLGSRANGWRDIFASPWFTTNSNNDDDNEPLDLKKLHRQEVPAPWVPNLKDPLDASRFHHDTSEVDDLMKMRGMPMLSEEQQMIFSTFGPLIESEHRTKIIE